MSNIVTTKEKDMLAVESALVRNDISQLSTQEKMTFYNNICESVGLNPLTKPFSFLKLQGREVLYATKDCTEQLRKIHGVSTQIVSKGSNGDLFEVHIKAQDKNGRVDEDLAYVVVKGMQGPDLANAMLKCITKAKRRVTLSICGLGVLDESELDTVSNISPASNPQIQNHFKDIGQTYETETLPPVIDQSDKIDPIDESVSGNTHDTNIDFDTYIINFGKKMKGRKFGDFTIDDHKSMVKYLVDGSERTNQPLTGEALEYKKNADIYIAKRSSPKVDESDSMNF